MIRLLCFVFCTISAADLLITLIKNFTDALVSNAASVPKTGLPVSPEFAFSWLQVLVNGSMSLLVLFGLWQLWHLVRTGAEKTRLKWSLPRILGISVVAVFGLPSLQIWFHIVLAIVNGEWGHISFDTPRYLMAAVSQTMLGVILLTALIQQCLLAGNRPDVSTVTENSDSA